MLTLTNVLIKPYLRHHLSALHEAIDRPIETQNAVLKHLLRAASDTEWGRAHGYASINTLETFQERVPVNDYDALKPYIDRMMRGEANILWRGKTNRFAKSSGTTHDKSKFIPVTQENLATCHLKGPKATLACWYREHPNSRLFAGKGLIMGGSLSAFDDHPQTTIGDVSALMMQQMPWLAKFVQSPGLDVALMDAWDSKIEQMTRLSIKENITNISGIPTWTLVLLRKILEMTGAPNMLDIFPNFEVYFHGGVNFRPYQEQFRHLFPDDRVRYREVYNASEGYFATRYEDADEDLLLLLNNGVFYEFAPLGEQGREQPTAYGLADVEVGRPYAMLISTNAGLWRYDLGDTVSFTSKNPYKIVITGRTAHFINAFGEEVMVANTDRALAMTCRAMRAMVADYTAAPIYFTAQQNGGHEWLVEFERAPDNVHAFATLLDRNLQAINSDYEAKRYGDIALQPLTLRPVPRGTFHRWLRAQGKLGGQHKVPRLANHRRYLDDIWAFHLHGQRHDASSTAPLQPPEEGS